MKSLSSPTVVFLDAVKAKEGKRARMKDDEKNARKSEQHQIWPLMSTFLYEAFRAGSKNLRALPVSNLTSPSRSSRKAWPPRSHMNRALSSSDSKPSSSVKKRSLTSGLYL